jgi:hypothetical protein
MGVLAQLSESKRALSSSSRFGIDRTGIFLQFDRTICLSRRDGLRFDLIENGEIYVIIECIVVVERV